MKQANGDDPCCGPSNLGGRLPANSNLLSGGSSRQFRMSATSSYPRLVASQGTGQGGPEASRLETVVGHVWRAVPVLLRACAVHPQEHGEQSHREKRASHAEPPPCSGLFVTELIDSCGDYSLFGSALGRQFPASWAVARRPFSTRLLLIRQVRGLWGCTSRGIQRWAAQMRDGGGINPQARAATAEQGLVWCGPSAINWTFRGSRAYKPRVP